MTLAGSADLVAEVIERLDATPDPRLRDILASLVRHLHAFVRDTRITEEEWSRGIAFLTAVGQKCDARRQEFILLSDVLGVSMQVVAVQHDPVAAGTEATVFGPFHVEGAPAIENGGDVANGARGTPCVVRATVRDLQGTPIAGATVDVWQSDDDGLYDIQRSDLAAAQGRGVLTSDAQGGFWFRSVLPVPYPIPMDGPVGDLMRATGRSPWRPAHLHFRIRAPGYRTLITHVFREGDPNLGSDPVFGVRPSLVATWPATAEGSHELRYDFVLEAAG